MRQVGTHSLTFVHSCDMHIIVHVLTHTHPHTLVYILHITHHTHCTSHIAHHTLHITHHTHYTFSIPYTYMDNTWHACGTVHCTTDPQAHSKRILLTGPPSVIARLDPTPIVLSYLYLSIIVGVYGCAYI